ncbi:MAG: response regulator [Actinobacteria bacterium]|nr:response regulator [Actinomycetota bacterium]
MTLIYKLEQRWKRHFKEKKTMKKKNTRILVVDDDEENTYFLKTMFDGRGYETVTVKNGAEALNRLKEVHIDLVISDILMPRMDGFQLCKECKKDDKFKDIPFIVYTAIYTEKKDIDFALGLGVDRVLTKPIEPEIILKTISDVIKEKNKKKNFTPEPVVIDEAIFLSEYSKRIVKKLEKKVADLNREISIRRQTEISLQHRLKELDCLFRISRLINNPVLSPEKLFKETLNILHYSWKYSGSICSRIIFNDEEYKTDNFKKSGLMQSALIKVNGIDSGKIEVYYREVEIKNFEVSFLEKEQNLINSVSGLIGLFVERKMAEKEQKESYKNLKKAIVIERNRIAGEFHDTVSQTLFSSNLMLESIKKTAVDNPMKIFPVIERVLKLNNAAFLEMRSLLYELKPLKFARESISDLIKRLADIIFLKNGISVDFRSTGKHEYQYKVKHEFYRIAQEAVNNITKHSQASSVKIDIRSFKNNLSLEIVDNGRGFYLQKEYPENFGINIMEERAKSIGAAIDIESWPGKGTRVQVVYKA